MGRRSRDDDLCSVEVKGRTMPNGGGIEMNGAWREAEDALADGRGIDTITNKLTIGGHDMYLKIGWHDSRPVMVDVTLTHNTRMERCYKDELQNELATNLVSNTKASLEIMCRQASALLQANVWTLDDMIAAWRGTQFEPSGVCPQAQMVAKSPLDAIARLCEIKKETWHVHADE